MNYTPFIITLAENKVDLAEQLYFIEKRIGVYQQFSPDLSLMYQRSAAKCLLFQAKKKAFDYQPPKVLLKKDNQPKFTCGLVFAKVVYAATLVFDDYSFPISKTVYLKPQFALTSGKVVQPYPLMDPVFREPSIQLFFVESGLF